MARFDPKVWTSLRMRRALYARIVKLRDHSVAETLDRVVELAIVRLEEEIDVPPIPKKRKAAAR